jgi:molybdopterin/thiamine biosynthesis adenylyltransferase
VAGRPIIPLDTPLTFSTFTYQSDGGLANPDLPDVLDVGKLTWIGVGAGGGAAAFAIASLREVRGAVTVIEPDRVEEPNLNRYVYADAEDARETRPKTQLIQHVLTRHSRLDVVPLSEPFSKAASELTAEDYRHVVAAVHSREARRQIQYETPAVLWDAGATDDGEFRIWRLIFGTTECMFCKHPPGDGDPEMEKARQLSELLGLDPQAWLRKLGNNSTFTAEECAAIGARMNGRERAFDLPTVGQAFGDWEASQCGRLVLGELDDEIPIPFAPVLAGVLLAGEIVKEFCFPDAVLDSCYWNTLMGQFMRRNRAHRRRPRPECTFCGEAVYRAQYDRRWGSEAARVNRGSSPDS